MYAKPDLFARKIDRPGARWLLNCHATCGEQLDVRDELTHRGTEIARVPAELPLELDAPAVAPGAVPELEQGVLEVAAAIEDPVDLRQGQEADPALRQVFDQREETREQARMMGGDHQLSCPHNKDILDIEQGSLEHGRRQCRFVTVPSSVLWGR